MLEQLFELALEFEEVFRTQPGMGGVGVGGGGLETHSLFTIAGEVEEDGEGVGDE